MRLVWSVLLVVASGAVVGCSNLSAPDQTVILGVSKLDAPSTVSSGQAINLVLSVELGGCLRFDRIETNRDASGANLIVWGKDISIGRKGITCTSELRIEPHSVDLQPPFQNPFTVMVQRGRLPPFVATVQVN